MQLSASAAASSAPRMSNSTGWQIFWGAADFEMLALSASAAWRGYGGSVSKIKDIGWPVSESGVSSYSKSTGVHGKLVRLGI